MGHHRETKIRWQAAFNRDPCAPFIVGAIHPRMALQIHTRWIFRVEAQFVRAQSRTWNIRMYPQSIDASSPGVATVVSSINATRRNCYIQTPWVLRMNQDRMQAETAEPRIPFRAIGMIEKRLIQPEGLATIV